MMGLRIVSSAVFEKRRNRCIAADLPISIHPRQIGPGRFAEVSPCGRPAPQQMQQPGCFFHRPCSLAGAEMAEERSPIIGTNKLLKLGAPIVALLVGDHDFGVTR